VAELVELVLVQPAARRTVDEAFETAEARLRLGVRPEDVRIWLLALAREHALTQVREHPELSVRPAEGLELLPYERTLLHLYRRCGIGADELAAALSDEPERLAVRLAQLDRRFLDYLAVSILVDERDLRCAAYNAIVAANEDRLEIRSFTRGHAHSCPDCHELIRARAETTDMLGRPTAIAVRPIPVYDHPRRRDGRRRLGLKSLVAGTVVAAIVATAAFATGKNDQSPNTPLQAGSADVTPPSPVGWVTATGGGRRIVPNPGVTVKWAAATDAVGVTGYEVYVDGALKSQTVGTSLVVTGIECGRVVSVGVDAFDAAGNRSPITSVQASSGRCGTGPHPATTPSPPTRSASSPPSGTPDSATTTSRPGRRESTPPPTSG